LTSADLPVLVVGDVHGDLQRLFGALEPYPAEAWRTIFLGDLVDCGDFGVGALRFARDRPNSTVLLGNHEVAMLWALRDRDRIGFWTSIGGRPHDLEELRGDPDLQEWMRRRPALLKLEDQTLYQHSDTDLYGRLASFDEPDVVEAVNRAVVELLQARREDVLWDLLSPGSLFRASRARLEAWLERTGSRRLVHGHKPHAARGPDAYHDGLAISFDGGFSRYGGSRFRPNRKVAATVGPLPPLLS
jgi:Calcineurin-like phosphoesterase